MRDILRSHGLADNKINSKKNLAKKLTNGRLKIIRFLNVLYVCESNTFGKQHANIQIGHTQSVANLYNFFTPLPHPKNTRYPFCPSLAQLPQDLRTRVMNGTLQLTKAEVAQRAREQVLEHTSVLRRMAAHLHLQPNGQQR